MIDDALSALDAYVGAKIMHDVFKSELKGKTKVLVTHKIDVLSHVDRIILMRGGEIILDDSKKEVMASPEYEEYSHTVEQSNDEARLEESNQLKLNLDRFSPSEEESKWEQNAKSGLLPENSRITGRMKKLGLHQKAQKHYGDDDIIVDENFNFKIVPRPSPKEEGKQGGHKFNSEKERLHQGKLTVLESKEEGVVKTSIYSHYCKKAGWCIVLLTLLMYTLLIFSRIVTDWWAGKWA